MPKQARRNARRAGLRKRGFISSRPRRAVTLIEMLIVITILSILLVLAIPSRSSMAQTQLLAAVRIIQADVKTMQSLARSAAPDEIYAMIMHYPNAPVAAATPLDPARALAYGPPKGACCIGTTCAENLTKSGCSDNGGTYLGKDTTCTELSYFCIDGGLPTITEESIAAALDLIPEIVYEGTVEWPNGAPAAATPWPGSSGGPAFDAVGPTDGDGSSFYRCGIIRNADTPDETFTELTRPDGRPWTFDFALQGLDLVTIGTAGSPDFYSVERALRFDHLGRPSRNVLFSLLAEDLTLAVTITTAGEVRWSLDATP